MLQKEVNYYKSDDLDGFIDEKKKILKSDLKGQRGRGQEEAHLFLP